MRRNTNARVLDKPEPRGQTIAAVLAVGAIYLALPRNVVVGPIWLLPTVIVVNVKNAAGSAALTCDRINSC